MVSYDLAADGAQLRGYVYTHDRWVYQGMMSQERGKGCS